MSSTPRLPDAVRISARGREILIKLKRYTGVPHWNTLCRIAYCYSLSLQTAPAASHEHEDTALEIEWPTFAGAFRVELAAITQFNASIEDVDASELGKYVRTHVERGLSAIQNTRSLSELVTIVLSATN